MTYSIDDQIKEVEREIAMRRRVYSRQVEQGKMDPEEMDRKVELMVAARESLLTLAPVKQASLFGGQVEYQSPGN